MTDRELLELAAKAAGITIDTSDSNGGGSGNDGFDILGNVVIDWYNNKRWNPLTDDGDALRLAVKLGMLYTYMQDRFEMFQRLYREELDNDLKPSDATRRAIVKAASEVGRKL